MTGGFELKPGGERSETLGVVALRREQLLVLLELDLRSSVSEGGDGRPVRRLLNELKGVLPAHAGIAAMAQRYQVPQIIRPTEAVGMDMASLMSPDFVRVARVLVGVGLVLLLHRKDQERHAAKATVRSIDRLVEALPPTLIRDEARRSNVLRYVPLRLAADAGKVDHKVDLDVGDRT